MTKKWFVITADLKSSAQCIAAEQKAQKILGFMKLVFRYRNKRMVLALCKEYCWSTVPSSGPWLGGVVVEHPERRCRPGLPSWSPRFTIRGIRGDYLISDSSFSTRGGLGACSLRPLRSLEVSKRKLDVILPGLNL